MKKPRVISPCVAERHNWSRNSRIVEFSNNGWEGLKGGLMALTNLPNQDFLVELYCLEPGVRVRVPVENLDISIEDLNKLIERKNSQLPSNLSLRD